MGSLLGKAVAIGGVRSGGNEKAASLGLEPLGNRLGRFRRVGDRLDLKGLGERLVDIGEADEEATWTGFGAIMLISSSSTALGDEEVDVRISAAESSTDGTDCSSVSEL